MSCRAKKKWGDTCYVKKKKKNRNVLARGNDPWQARSLGSSDLGRTVEQILGSTYTFGTVCRVLPAT